LNYLIGQLGGAVATSRTCEALLVLPTRLQPARAPVPCAVEEEAVDDEPTDARRPAGSAAGSSASTPAHCSTCCRAARAVTSAKDRSDAADCRHRRGGT
jgi:hypothetical protein